MKMFQNIKGGIPLIPTRTGFYLLFGYCKEKTNLYSLLKGNNNSRRRLAFTLAEVMITIGIIGIIAALTIPTLIQKSNEREMVSSFLKLHNTLSNAFKEMEAVEGLKVSNMNMESEAENNSAYFPSLFEGHLKTINPCEEGKVCLADGSTFEYQESNFDGACTIEDPCTKLIIDVNGKKRPNSAGKDQYTLLVTKDGIKCLGTETECNGLDCGAYVLSHHKLWNGEIDAPANNEITENHFDN